MKKEKEDTTQGSDMQHFARTMANITARFIGSGDAFGSGGRLQTCILINAPGIRFTIDFGATSLIGLRRQNIDPNSIDAILLTHLHGDHCAGCGPVRQITRSARCSIHRSPENACPWSEVRLLPPEYGQPPIRRSSESASLSFAVAP